jgi:hypothetical protein
MISGAHSPALRPMKATAIPVSVICSVTHAVESPLAITFAGQMRHFWLRRTACPPESFGLSKEQQTRPRLSPFVTRRKLPRGNR